MLKRLTAALRMATTWWPSSVVRRSTKTAEATATVPKWSRPASRRPPALASAQSSRRTSGTSRRMAPARAWVIRSRPKRSVRSSAPAARRSAALHGLGQDQHRPPRGRGGRGRGDQARPVTAARQIPPHLHLTEVNPRIRLDELPCDDPDRPGSVVGRRWSTDRGSELLGVSGTNAHVVVEQAPDSRHDVERVHAPAPARAAALGTLCRLTPRAGRSLRIVPRRQRHTRRPRAHLPQRRSPSRPLQPSPHGRRVRP